LVELAFWLLFLQLNLEKKGKLVNL